jgi:mono/diheme cytochrome c family protein
MFNLPERDPTMKIVIPILFALCTVSAQAATPADLLAGYRTEAAQQTPGFQPSAQRGAEFYKRSFNVSAKMPSCASCHTDNPAQAGRHVVTDKPIKPLSTTANTERFTDPAKAEKWFRRNCTEVVGRECSAAEKADFIAFLKDGR